MKATRILLAAVLTLSGCATIESVFKPTPQTPSAGPPGPPPGPTAPTRVRPAPPVLPPLQPQLSEAEERRLRDQATRHIADAERATRGIQADALQPAGRETLGTIQSFLEQARQALTARDYDRASTLAQKAERLAQDLSQAAR